MFGLATAQILRIVGILAGLALVAWLGAWGYHWVYHQGLAAGRAEIQVQWDADKVAIAATAAKQVAENAAAAAAAAKTNQETIDAYKAQLAALSVAADSYAGKLRLAEARGAACGSALSQAVSGPGATPAAAPGGQGALELAVGARLAECDANESQLRSLIREVEPQL